MTSRIETRSTTLPRPTRTFSATSPICEEDLEGVLTVRPPRGSSASGKTSRAAQEGLRSRSAGKGSSSRGMAANGEKSAKKSKGSSRKEGHTDLIDQLDITTGFGAFHHDGPFDAASSHRNRANARRPAPMAAFDPLALTPNGAIASGVVSDPYAAASRPPKSSPQSFMDGKDGYHVLPSVSYDGEAGYPPRGRRGSEEEAVTLGYPVNERKYDSKSKAVAEAFGFVDSEAWEDYGRSRYTRQAPRQSVLPSDSRFTKEQRAERAASVWDMEATLKAGKPVGAAPPLPPMPVQYIDGNAHIHARSQSTPTGPGLVPSSSGTFDDGEPKRSKSLMQRIKKVRDQGNLPMSAAADDDRSIVGKATDVVPPIVSSIDSFSFVAASDEGDSVLDEVLGDESDAEKHAWMDRSPSKNGASGLARKTSLVQRMRGLATR